MLECSEDELEALLKIMTECLLHLKCSDLKIDDNNAAYHDQFCDCHASSPYPSGPCSST